MDNPNPRPYHQAMQPGQPSRTALGAAGLRAAHQVLDGAAIFADPLALRILGADADDLVREAEAEADPFRQRLRRPGAPRMRRWPRGLPRPAKASAITSTAISFMSG